MFKTQTQKTPRKKRRLRSRNQPGDMSTVDREKHPHKLTTTVRSASCSLYTSADNVTLAVAAERRPCSNRSISPARRAHSSKPAARCCSVRSINGTDERTDRKTERRRDTVPLHRPCRIMRPVSIIYLCLYRLHMAQLMPLPLTVSWFSKIQIGFTFLVPAHPGSPVKRAVKRVCVYTAKG